MFYQYRLLEAEDRAGTPLNFLAHLGCNCSLPRSSSVVLVVKNQPTNAGNVKRQEFYAWVGKISWRRAWQPIPVFLPGESHGQRSLVGGSPWGHKESDTTEVTSCAHTHVLST